MSNPHPVNQIILVALSDLQDPDWNPRPFLDEAEMPSLVDFILAGGHIPPVTLLKGSDQAPWDVISGKRRCEAARRAGKTHIEAIKLDITLEEAKFLAIAANRDNKPFWLGEFVAIENLKLGNPNLKQVDIIAKLGWSKKRVSYAFNLTPLLTPASRGFIYQTAQPKVPARNFSDNENTPEIALKADWCLTEDVAIRLIPLLKVDPLEGAQTLAEKVVQTIVKQQLTGPQTDELVNHALAGSDLAQFNPTAKVKKARKAASPQTYPQLAAQNSPAAQELAPSTTSTSLDSPVPTSSPIKTSQPKAATAPQPMSESAPSSSSGTGANKASASPGQLGTVEQLAWDAAVGISIISRIKAKIKKGERPSFFEALLLAGHYVGRGLVWLSQHGFKLIWHITKTIWKLLKKSLKGAARGLGKKAYGILQAVFSIGFILLLGWLVWTLYHDGLFHRVKGTVSRMMPAQAVPVPTPVPQSQPTVIPTPTVTDVAKPVTEAKPAKPSSQNASAPAAKSSVVGAAVQPTPAVHKTDVAEDILKQAPAAADVAKKLLGF